jgi:broad specificity phosphatase PhoE
MDDTLVDFIRHGEPVGGRRYRGDGVDDPLSEKGWRQMRAALGGQRPWQRVVTSPLQRCHAFALSLAEQNGLPLTVETRFREVGLGAWEGLTPDDILRDDPDAYAAFYRDPQRNRPRGAETLEAFGTRVAAALEDVFVACAGEHVLVVAHAGVIRAALGHVLQSDPVAWYRTRVDNAALTRFRRGQYGNKLEFHNRLSLG